METQTSLRSRSSVRRNSCEALRFFGAPRIDQARDAAETLLCAAARCPRCKQLLEERVERLGSTLFYDDDPRQLLQAFPAATRDACSLRVLAACIVCYGRARVSVVEGDSHALH